jgi:hypothetical protein
MAITERVKARHAALRLDSKPFQTFGTHGHFFDTTKAGWIGGLGAHMGVG